jgi:membrane protease YdiL (CAAX protease family)
MTAVILHGATPLHALAGDPGLTVSWLMEIAIALVLIQFWEEIGWTGFVLHRLQPRLGPVRATLTTTWAQAAFHIPLLFIVGGVSDTRLTPDQYPFFLAALFFFPLGNRMVLTWLYNRSGRSLPVAGLIHSSWNFAAGSAFLPALVSGFNSIWAYVGFAVVAVVLIVGTRGRLGYEPATAATEAAATRAFAPMEASGR